MFTYKTLEACVVLSVSMIVVVLRGIPPPLSTPYDSLRINVFYANLCRKFIVKSCGDPLPGDTIILYSEFFPMMYQNNKVSLKLITMTTCALYDQTFTKRVFVNISNMSNIYLETHLAYIVYYIRT